MSFISCSKLCREQYFRSHAGVKSEVTLVCWFLALTDGAIRPPLTLPAVRWVCRRQCQQMPHGWFALLFWAMLHNIIYSGGKSLKLHVIVLSTKKTHHNTVIPHLHFPHLAWAGLGFIHFEMHCIKSSVKSNKTVFKETSWFQPPLLERLVFLQSLITVTHDSWITVKTGITCKPRAA